MHRNKDFLSASAIVLCATILVLVPHACRATQQQRLDIVGNYWSGQVDKNWTLWENALTEETVFNSSASAGSTVGKTAIMQTLGTIGVILYDILSIDVLRMWSDRDDRVITVYVEKTMLNMELGTQLRMQFMFFAEFERQPRGPGGTLVETVVYAYEQIAFTVPYLLSQLNPPSTEEGVALMCLHAADKCGASMPTYGVDPITGRNVTCVEYWRGAPTVPVGGKWSSTGRTLSCVMGVLAAVGPFPAAILCPNIGLPQPPATGCWD